MNYMHRLRWSWGLRQSHQKDVSQRAEAAEKECVKGAEVVAANTLSHPGAMMIVTLHAHLAELAVLAASGLSYLADVTPAHPHGQRLCNGRDVVFLQHARV